MLFRDIGRKYRDLKVDLLGHVPATPGAFLAAREADDPRAERMGWHDGDKGVLSTSKENREMLEKLGPQEPQLLQMGIYEPPAETALLKAHKILRNSVRETAQFGDHHLAGMMGRYNSLKTSLSNIGKKEKVYATYDAYVAAVNIGDPIAERMIKPDAGYEGPILATREEGWVQYQKDPDGALTHQMKVYDPPEPTLTRKAVMSAKFLKDNVRARLKRSVRNLRGVQNRKFTP